MDIELLIKLDITLIVSAVSFYLVFNSYSHKLGFDTRKAVVWVIFLLVVAVIELFLWLFQIEPLENQSITPLPLYQRNVESASHSGVGKP